MSSPGSQLVAYDLGRMKSAEEVDDVTEAEHEKVLAQRNSYALINQRLPPEIICDIFLQLMRHCYWLYDKTYLQRRRTALPRRDPYAWIMVTHVCRYWRNTALHCSKLWTLICRKQVDIVRTFVSRSGQAPLDIVGHHGDQKAYEAMKILFNEGGRWRSFEISARACCFRWKELPSAPFLEVLRLNCLSYDPSSFFELPRLRSVYLAYSPFSFAERIVKQGTITILNLRNITPAQNLTTWVGVLQSLPCLEELKLENIFASSPVHPDLHSQQVSLPRLRSLSLVQSEGASASATLLSMISFPPSTRISIRGHLSSSDDDSVNLLQNLFIDRAAGADPAQVPRLHTCRIVCPHSSRLRPSVSIQAWTEELSLNNLFSKSSPPEPLISLSWGAKRLEYAYNTTRTFFDIAPLSDLHLLSFVGLLSCAVTEEHNAKLPNVRVLYVDYVHEDSLEGDAEALCPPEDGGIPLPFPNLDHLAFRASLRHGHLLDLSGNSVEDTIYDVRGMLLRRQAAGLSLKSLDIITALRMDAGEVAALMNDGLVEKVKIVRKRRDEGEDEYERTRRKSWRHTHR